MPLACICCTVCSDSWEYFLGSETDFDLCACIMWQH